MSEEKRSPSDKLRALLDELGVEYETYVLPNGECGVSWIDGNDIEWEAVQRGENFEIHALQLVTPEQAIAATVGNGTDLSKRLREVHGLHEFAELFGFDWTDESDWGWHDVACAMADAIDATAGVGTCEGSFHESSDLSSGRVPIYYCKDTNRSIFVEREAKVCPLCGRRIKEEAE